MYRKKRRQRSTLSVDRPSDSRHNAPVSRWVWRGPRVGACFSLSSECRRGHSSRDSWALFRLEEVSVLSVPFSLLPPRLLGAYWYYLCLCALEGNDCSIPERNNSGWPVHRCRLCLGRPCRKNNHGRWTVPPSLCLSLPLFLPDPYMRGWFLFFFWDLFF